MAEGGGTRLRTGREPRDRAGARHGGAVRLRGNTEGGTGTALVESPADRALVEVTDLHAQTRPAGREPLRAVVRGEGVTAPAVPHDAQLLEPRRPGPGSP
ncbi:hypothetical protein [Streptomyces chryseus]